MDAAMETKLREMIDRQDIWQVLQRYGRGLDRMDREMARSCYFDDAIDDHGSFVGNIEDFLDYADRATLSFITCHHGVMNHYCELDGDDAHTETYYLFTGVNEKPPHLFSMGRYIDHFQRRDGEWRIANRVTIIERNFALWDNESIGRIPMAYGPDEQQQPATLDRGDVSYHRPLVPRAPRPQAWRD